MASGNGVRIVPQSVPMTITPIGAGEFVPDSGSGHGIDLEPADVYP